MDYVQVAALVAILATNWSALEAAQRLRPSADGRKLIDVARCKLRAVPLLMRKSTPKTVHQARLSSPNQRSTLE